MFTYHFNLEPNLQIIKLTEVYEKSSIFWCIMWEVNIVLNDKNPLVYKIPKMTLVFSWCVCFFLCLFFSSFALSNCFWWAQIKTKKYITPSSMHSSCFEVFVKYSKKFPNVFGHTLYKLIMSPQKQKAPSILQEACYTLHLQRKVQEMFWGHMHPLALIISYQSIYV